MFLGLDAVTWVFVVMGLLVAVGIYVRDERNGRTYEWSRRPTALERILAGAWLVAIAVVEVSRWTGWNLLRGYEKQAEGALIIIVVVLAYRVFPLARRA